MAENDLSFHMYLRYAWRLDYCPVCFLKCYLYYRKQFICMKCDSSDSLFYCLICGYVGCGDEGFNHHTDHFLQVGHNFSVRLSDFRVWNFQAKLWSHGSNSDGIESDSFTVSTFFSKCACYVCLYKKSPRLLKRYFCMQCNTSPQNLLLLCLTCGHVGCDSISSCHARLHYTATGHTLAAHVESLWTFDFSQRKWLKNITHFSESSSPESNSIFDDYAESTTTESLLLEHSVALNELREEKIGFAKRLDALEKRLKECRCLMTLNQKVISLKNCVNDLQTELIRVRRKCQVNETKLYRIKKQVSVRKFVECRNPLTSTCYSVLIIIFVIIALIFVFLIPYVFLSKKKKIINKFAHLDI